MALRFSIEMRWIRSARASEWCQSRVGSSLLVARVGEDSEGQVSGRWWVTLLSREALEIDDDGEIVAMLGRAGYVGPILSGEDLFGAVAVQLAEAFYGDGYEDLGLGFGGRDVEGHAIEVGDDLVYRYRRCAEPLQSACV